MDKRLERDGPNALSPLKDTPEILKFLGELFSGFNCLLWLGAVLSFIVYGLSFLNNGSPDPSDVGNILNLNAFVNAPLCRRMTVKSWERDNVSE